GFCGELTRKQYGSSRRLVHQIRKSHRRRESWKYSLDECRCTSSSVAPTESTCTTASRVSPLSAELLKTLCAASRIHTAPKTVTATRAQLRPRRMKCSSAIHTPATSTSASTATSTVTCRSARICSKVKRCPSAVRICSTMARSSASDTDSTENAKIAKPTSTLNKPAQNASSTELGRDARPDPPGTGRCAPPAPCDSATSSE